MTNRISYPRDSRNPRLSRFDSCLFALTCHAVASAKVDSWLALLLIRWHFRQSWRQQALLLFFLVVEREASWSDHSRCDEDDQIAFYMLIDVGTEETSNKRNIANDRRFI